MALDPVILYMNKAGYITAEKISKKFSFKLHGRKNRVDVAEFIFDNLSIQVNLIHSAYLCGIKNLIFLGSSCVYPRNCKQPIKESYLLDGKLESTNDAYAVAKIAGIELIKSYRKEYGYK